MDSFLLKTEPVPVAASKFSFFIIIIEDALDRYWWISDWTSAPEIELIILVSTP